MPPRPRPRPRAIPVSASSEGPSASKALSPNARRKPTKKEEDDEDAMFMRNKERSLREVNKRFERAAALAVTSSLSTESDDEGEDEEDTPKQGAGKNRKRNMFKAGTANTLPTWTKKGGINTLLRESDSESENNPSIFEGSPSKRRRAGASGSNAGTPTGKRSKQARSRSRSRSLTPPPSLTRAQMLFAQQAIRNVLGSQYGDLRPPSPEAEVEDDPDDARDTMALAPELQAIVRDRKQKAGTEARLDRPGLTPHHSSSGPVNVSVRVKWVAHPEDDAMYGRLQPTWAFTVKRHESLKEMFLQLADLAHVLSDDLVLLRDRKQVFQLVSPEGLGVWDQVDFEACDKGTFEALRARHFRSPTPVQNNQEDDNAPDREPSAAPSDTLVESNDDDKFKLVLRAKGTKDVTLSVRPTTTCGRIVRAFLGVVVKHGAKVSASPRKHAQVRLCIDGEKMDPEAPIANCDLEDGDMVEVVGLAVLPS